MDIRSLNEILDMNWLLLFKEVDGGAKEFFVSTLMNLVEEGRLVPLGDQLADKMIRGVEMFGPNFFLLPNEHWAVERIEADGSLTIVSRHGELSLMIPDDYLKRTLRKPSLYVDRFVVEPDHYFLVIPPVDPGQLPEDLRRYIEWGEAHEHMIPAVRNFGRFWFSHVYKQMRSKRPFGTLFLPDKIDAGFKRRGVFSIITDAPTTATKNFYILKIGAELARVLTLWFNSSLFIGFFIYGSRRISRSWTRFLEEDYLRLPIPDISRISEEHVKEASELIGRIRELRTPPISDQEGWPVREEIDFFIANLLGLKRPEELVRHLHEALFDALRSRKR